MEFTVSMMVRAVLIANAVPLALLLWFMVAPFITQTAFSIVVDGMRYGYGSGGYTIQDTRDWRVIRQGWFPWHSREQDVNRP